MRFLDIEGSQAAERADFAVYGLAVLALAAALVGRAPGPAWPLLLTVLAGFLAWSLLEYLLHRFVLHGVEPFRTMHARHHQRPRAHIGIPTLLSAPMFALLLFTPAWWWAGAWLAAALTLGLLLGYLTYAVTHHLCHFGPVHGRWTWRHQLWHARHHQRSGAPGCFGVSHRFWDHVFGTALAPRASPPLPASDSPSLQRS
jgi:sterol desaturase/sphingolipid hydroxylase (fatty acid hydroxylase superfamily)